MVLGNVYNLLPKRMYRNVRLLNKKVRSHLASILQNDVMQAIMFYSSC